MPSPLPPHRAPDQGEEFLSHQAGKRKANFQEPGLGNFQEGDDDLSNSSRKLPLYMDYLLITDFQNIFVCNEFPVKLYNFFSILLYFSFFKFIYISDILCYYPSEDIFLVSPFKNLTLWCFNSFDTIIVWLVWKRLPEGNPKSEHLGEGMIFRFRQGGSDPGWYYDRYLIVQITDCFRRFFSSLENNSYLTFTLIDSISWSFQNTFTK